MNIYRRSLKSVCRTCLAEINKGTEHDTIYNIYETEGVVKWLLWTSSLTVQKDDKLPQFLCSKCFVTLRQCHEFRSNILRSNRILQDMLRLAIELESDEETKVTEEPAYETIVETVDDDTNTILQEPQELEAMNEAMDVNGEWLRYELVRHEEEVDEASEAEYHMLSEQMVVEEALSSDLIEPLEATEAIVGIVDEPPLGVSEGSERTEEVEGLDERLDECETENSGVNIEVIENDSLAYYDEADDDPEFDVGAEAETESEGDEEIVESCQSLTSQGKGTERPKRSEMKFYCEECPQRWFLTQDNLDAHKRTHDGLRPFACKECDRSFNVSSQLKLHVREDHSNNPQPKICPHEGCGRAFTKSGSLKTHVRYKHANSIPFICEECGRGFKNSTKFKEHRYKHVPVSEYPYQCDQCDKRFIAKSRYDLHLVRHSGVKSFECPHCDMKKYTRDELKAHINSHTRERQWPCRFCPKVFNTSTNWRIHDTTVHKGIRKFVCRYCERTFGRPHTRKRHEMIHTGEKPYVCYICDKRFIQATTLKTHLKTHKKAEATNVPPSP